MSYLPVDQYMKSSVGLRLCSAHNGSFGTYRDPTESIQKGRRIEHFHSISESKAYKFSIVAFHQNQTDSQKILEDLRNFFWK